MIGQRVIQAIAEKDIQSIFDRCNQNKMTVRELAKLGAKFMRKANCHHHFFADHSLFQNALYLCYYSLNFPADYSNQKYLKKILKKAEAAQILKLFERRILEKIPVEYISEETFYLGNKFYINKNVLVPRSLMNTRFKDFLEAQHWENYRVLDLCAGSGCIGISLALMNPNIHVDLVDISQQALNVAEINIRNYKLEERVRCLQSDLFKNIKDKYDLIITNPPYVSEREYDLQPEEIKNEPMIALQGGKQGLDLIEKILKQSKYYLNPEGRLIAEVGYPVAKLLKRKYKKIRFEWFKCLHPGKESLLDKIIEIIGYLDSIFICQARNLQNIE